MAFDKSIWDQLKNTTASRLIQALLADNWEEEATRGAPRAFVKNDGSGKRIVIHFHSQKTYGPRMLKGLLADIGWSKDDLKRLKLIK